MAGMSLTIIGGLIAGIPRIWDPVRLLYLALVVFVASVAMISLMFLVMVRIDDPLVPRAIFGVLNMLLFFPVGSGLSHRSVPEVAELDLRDRSVSPTRCMRCEISRSRIPGFEGIYMDVLVLTGFSALMISGSIALFKRQL